MAHTHLILGGPLTGKTHRLIQIYLDDYRRPPSSPSGKGVGGAGTDGYGKKDSLCLSFFDANAGNVRRILESKTNEPLPVITSLQRFVFSLLRDHAGLAGLPDEATVISAVGRLLVIRQAWESAGGPLWRRYRNTPGAMEELTRIINWISLNRTQFALAEDELSDHEISRIYACYIELCTRHRLLTFQEATLRALDVLLLDGIAAALHRRFPALLIDDLHLARPDQLALIGCLRSSDGICIATAWLHENHMDPFLRHVWETIQGWGSIESLTMPASGVNPVIHHVASRLNGMAGIYQDSHGGTADLITADTVEDETRTVAHYITGILEADPTLQPHDIIVVCPDTGLKRFMQRNLHRAAVPTAAPLPSVRQNPLIRAGLLIVRWYARGASTDMVHALLRLPVFDLDPLDLDTLDRAAREHGRLVLDFGEADDLLLRKPETLSIIATLRRCLTDSGRKQPFSERIHQALTDLGAILWTQAPNAFSEEQNASWVSSYLTWIDHIRALEQTAEVLESRSSDLLSFIEQLADQSSVSREAVGVRVIEPEEADGMRGRVACVVGMSENAAPQPESPMQLVEEHTLPGLFADTRSVVLPAVREQSAWIERESRRLALLLSRGSERLCVSVSRYAAGGDAQLPSPFFEALLADEGEIDRDGRIDVRDTRLWGHIPAARSVTYGIDETAIPDTPLLDGVQTPNGESDTARVLHAHIYSASQMRTYLRCPLQFFYDRVLRLDSDESRGALDRGALLHEILCAAIGDGRLEKVDLLNRLRPAWMDDTGSLTERALTGLDAAWTGQTVELPGGGQYTPSETWEPRFGPTLQRDAVKRWAGRVLRQWAEFDVEGRGEGAPPRRPVLLEMAFDIQIDGYMMIGRIDRVDEVIIDGERIYDVIDYKTGAAGADSLSAQVKKFLPEHEEDPPSDYQLPIYALALRNGVGDIRAIPHMLTYINLDRLEKTPRGKFKTEAMRSVYLTARQTVDTKQGLVPVSYLTGTILDGIKTTLDAMSSSPYPANPGFYCNMCGFRAACSRGRAYVGE